MITTSEIVLTGGGIAPISFWYHLIFPLDYQARYHEILSMSTTMMTTTSSIIINEDRIEDDKMIK